MSDPSSAAKTTEDHIILAPAHTPGVAAEPDLPFDGSTVLATVGPGTLALLAARLKHWLPGSGAPVLLFRMSRDGTSTSDFHSRCDGQASTLTLIKSSDGFVFGGYAGAAWNSGNAYIACATAFIFTVANPHGIPPTRYLLIPGSDAYALRGFALSGPRFGGPDIYVGANDGSLTSAGMLRFSCYADTTGYGSATFTGDTTFTASEVEVWQLPM